MDFHLNFVNIRSFLDIYVSLFPKGSNSNKSSAKLIATKVSQITNNFLRIYAPASSKTSSILRKNRKITQTQQEFALKIINLKTSLNVQWHQQTENNHQSLLSECQKCYFCCLCRVMLRITMKNRSGNRFKREKSKNFLLQKSKRARWTVTWLWHIIS